MAPIPQEVNIDMEGDELSTPLADDDIVISGMSALSPGCHNVMEFADKLYDKVNMACGESSRWHCSHPEVPRLVGLIPALDRFDGQFFMVFNRLSHCMDAITRKLLEHSYQAIFDAGVCPVELNGRSVGVFAASGMSESEKAVAYTELYHGIVGCNRAMFANRISYYLNLTGPSVVLDADGCGSLAALQKAFQAIRTGQCEAAIVGAVKLMLHPHTAIHYGRQVPLNTDGKMKCYDANADGQTLSEAVNVIFLQKYKDAKRVYACVRHVKAAFSSQLVEGLPQKFSPYRDPEALSRFLREFYNEARVTPSLVEYVEGFGAALPDADKSELLAIEEVFCKDRTTQLMVGSVMSNVGYTDVASGLTALIKVLLAYQRGVIAGNINCSNPRQDVPALCDGRMRILTAHHAFRRSYAAVNSLSLTGVNGHLLLQGCYKPKNHPEYCSKIPHLVLLSGRQESSVKRILDDIKGRPLDAEEVALLNGFHKIRIPKHLARGYGIYEKRENKNICLSEKVDHFDEAKRPLWFVYSGMGSQWAGMGAQLMRIPVFAAAIQRCHRVLTTKGLDIVDIITSPDKTIFDNILNSFVGIAAVQIGLTDVLRAVGLVPNNIIGHSVGELGCAYCDDCCSAEEMILMAYSRGLISIQTPFVRGSMAAVGIGYKQMSKMVPPEIEVACHNGPDSSTISGPADVMRHFVAKLTAQGIFAKEVPCSNIAYHSQYIAEAGPGLLKYLTDVIKSPKPRSERWVSTSVPKERWHEPAAKTSSAEYHTNNLLNPVLFEETSRLIPADAVLIEIAPHGLLQAILKRSLPVTCHHIPLTRRNHPDNAIFLLEAIGSLYMDGYDIDISALYPKIEYPVSTETRSLSHLVEWDHAEKLRLSNFIAVERNRNAVYKPIISVYDDEYQYLSGHVIEGTRVFPFAGAIVLAWDTLAMTVDKPRDHLTVQFRDITFHTQPPIWDQKALHLDISLHRGSGRFEVTYEHGLIADGYITMIVTSAQFQSYQYTGENVVMHLASGDIYKLLFERGYHYKDEFRSIKGMNSSQDQAQLAWNHNWVTFLDGMLQLGALRRNHNGISQPQYIKHLHIDVENHFYERTKAESTIGAIDARFDDVLNVIWCGGVKMEHAIYKDRPQLLRQTPGIKKLTFVPFFREDQDNVDILTTLYIFLQIVAENLNKNLINVYYIGEGNKPCVLDKVWNLLSTPPEIKLNVVRVKKEDILEYKCQKEKADLIFIDKLLSDKKVFEALHQIIAVDTFVASLGVETEYMYPAAVFHQVCSVGKGRTRLELAKWRPSKSVPTAAVVSVRTDADLEFLCTTRQQLPSRHKILVLASYPLASGLRKLVKQWRTESEHSQINVALINNKYFEDDVKNLPTFDLIFNVFNNGTWGGEYFIPLCKSHTIASNVVLQSSHLGDLNSLQWVEAPPIHGSEVPIMVQYAGLNVYDAKRVMAEVPAKNTLNEGFGMDFSGFTNRGDRVMGLAPEGSARSKLLARPELLWPVPTHWSLEDAATVPLAYAMAFYCLDIKCKLIRGMTVLIHGGAGALGQAAINIALGNGCTVFTTVSDIHKKRLLCRIFPDLQAEHIGNSRDVTFSDMVLNATKGEGCDIIISSVRAELKESTLRCCAASGITLDTVQIHTQENYTYGMFSMTKSRSYVPIDFSSIFNHNREELMRIQWLISEGISRGYVRPLSRVTFAPNEVPRAFRLIAGSRHRGRVLIRLNDSIHTVPRINYSSKHSYLVLCDKEGFGFQLADKLVRHGVRHLYLHTPDQSSYLDIKIQLWQKYFGNMEVYVSHECLCSKKAITMLLENCNRIAPLDGIYIAATDSFGNESKSVVVNLDLASRKMCPSLRYFVIVTESDDFGHEISLDRTQHGLASTLLQLSNLRKFDDKELDEKADKKIVLNYQCAVNAVESAIHSKKPVLLAFAEQRPLGLIEELGSMPGIKLTSATRGRTTLEKVGVDYRRAQEFCNLLEEKFNIKMHKEKILQLTINELKEMQHVSTDDQKDSSTFSRYVEYIDSDELLANVDVVPMQTLAHDSLMRPDEFITEQPHMCVVPGVEAHHARFGALCERLKLPAIVLQPGFNAAETIAQIAERFVEIMTRKLKLNDHFYLLGYQFGVFVVLEMAQILESRGYTGTVYCLGGTPKDIRAAMRAKIGEVSMDTIQNSLVKHMYNLLTGNNSKKLEQELVNKSWEEKVKTLVKMSRGIVPHDMQYTQAFMESAYARIMMTYNYSQKPYKLKSKIVIIRSRRTENDTSLESLEMSDTNIHELDTLNILKDLRCATLINKYLEPKILESFYESNHCETSLLKHEMIEFSFAKD